MLRQVDNSTLVKPHRTRIDKLSTAGYELSEEHLRLVAGARPSSSGPTCGPCGPDC